MASLISQKKGAQSALFMSPFASTKLAKPLFKITVAAYQAIFRMGVESKLLHLRWYRNNIRWCGGIYDGVFPSCRRTRFIRRFLRYD